MTETLLFSRGQAQLVLPEGSIDAVVYAPVNDENLRELTALLDPGIALVALTGGDWNRDYSPWPAAAVFRDGDFSGGGSTFLAALANELIPAVEAQLPVVPRIMAGYSLAGLFAVWAAMETDFFAGAAGVSGSLWFDGFEEFARLHPCHARAVYLSVGDREKHTRNPRMQRVEDAIRQVYAGLAAQGVDTIFELNPGNHFQQSTLRLARGINWTCRQLIGTARERETRRQRHGESDHRGV